MAVNMALQGILSLPVQQVAAAQQLGAFIKTYQATLTKTVVGAITFVVAGVFFCAGGIFTVATRVILLVFGLLSLGLAISMAYSIIQVAARGCGSIHIPALGSLGGQWWRCL